MFFFLHYPSHSHAHSQLQVGHLPRKPLRSTIGVSHVKNSEQQMKFVLSSWWWLPRTACHLFTKPNRHTLVFLNMKFLLLFFSWSHFWIYIAWFHQVYKWYTISKGASDKPHEFLSGSICFSCNLCCFRRWYSFSHGCCSKCPKIALCWSLLQDVEERALTRMGVEKSISALTKPLDSRKTSIHFISLYIHWTPTIHQYYPGQGGYKDKLDVVSLSSRCS